MRTEFELQEQFEILQSHLAFIAKTKNDGNPMPPVNLANVKVTTEHLDFDDGKKSKVHTGIDLSCPTGSVVVAFGVNFEINYVWRNHKALGNALVGSFFHLERQTTIHFCMAHLENITDEITGTGVYLKKFKAGTIIGHVGTTGYSTGPHLHLETWKIPRDTKHMNSKENIEKVTYDPRDIFLEFNDKI